MDVLDQPSAEGRGFNFDEKANQLVANGYSFNAGEYIAAGNRILSKNAGSFIGYLIIYFLISIILGFIPIVGSLISWVIGPALTIGFAVVARRIFYNKDFQFGNFFDGFKFVAHLFMVSLFQTIIGLIVVLPFLFIVMGPVFRELLFSVIQGTTPAIDPEEFMSRLVWLIPAVLLIIIVQLLFAFAPYIVTFARKSFWESITWSAKIIWKNAFRFFTFLLLLLLVNLGGALLLFVGLLYTVPLTFCALFASYQSVVGTMPEDPVLDN